MTYRIRLFSVTLPLLTAMAAISIYAQNTGIPAEGVLKAERISIPAATELKAGQKKVRDLFAGDFKAAKLPAQKWQLATKLAKEAEATTADSESEYALSMEAVGLFVGVGDALSAFRAIDELSLTFDLDPIAVKVDLLQKAGKEAKAAALKRMLALVGLKLAGDAADVEQYEAAKEVAALSLQLAKPSRDSSVLKRAIEQQARFADLHKQWSAVVDARKTLSTDPVNIEANEIVGKYLCLVRQQWDEGLPHLKQGADQELKLAAAADLATTPDAKSRGETAENWWLIAESKKAAEKQQILSRVAYWLELAIPELSSLSKATAEKRLDSAYLAMSGRDFKKISESPANGIQSQGVVDCTQKFHPASMGKTFDFRRSWLAAFQFSPPNLEGGWHMVVFWGDGRLGRDPLYFRQDGAALCCGVDDTVNARGQGIWAPLLSSQINDWIDIKFIHDSVSQELELYVNNRLVKKEALAITPQVDREMNVVLGGTNDHTPQRFLGKVRNVWIGNIK